MQRKTAQYGRNVPSPPKTRYTRKVFGYLFGGFGSVLLLGSILVFISWKPLGQPPALANLALAIVLFAVFLIQAAFNMWQDWSSSRVVASIKTMLPDSCLALRDGTQVTLLARELVPGDVLLVRAGNKLPADVRFVEVADAKFDRSILTGKEVPLGVVGWFEADPSQVKVPPWLRLSTRPTQTTWRRGASASRAHIASQAPAMVSLLRLATALSLAELPNLAVSRSRD